MKEQFQMKLPKRPKTSDLVKEKSRRKQPVHVATDQEGEGSEAEGSQPILTTLRLPGSPWAGVGVIPQGQFIPQETGWMFYCIITSFTQNFPNQTKNSFFRSGFSSYEMLVSPCRNQNFQRDRPRRANTPALRHSS